jgi:hypothetical protein
VTENLLIFSIKRFIIGFINALIFVVPLEYIGVLFGLFESFDGKNIVYTCCVLALIQLCLILFTIEIKIEEEE